MIGWLQAIGKVVGRARQVYRMEWVCCSGMIELSICRGPEIRLLRGHTRKIGEAA